MEKKKVSNGKNPNAPAASSAKPAATPPARPAPPPLFRPVDWFALGATFLFVFVAYLLTLAPEMTLEDSGELAVASYYAGIPHPPGYPIWTIFTYFWSLIPAGNVAWRVGIGCAFSGALATSLLAMVVSRGSSMIIESIDDLKTLDRRWENAICAVSGFVAGCLLGFNGYMWSQSVIVEVYPLSVASLLGVVLCLMRWVYAPHQHRYLYGAFFLYGICVNNHQSLLVIAMGLEILVIAAEPKLGRQMLFWNTLIYLVGLVLRPDILAGNTPVFVIFNTIGLASTGGWIWLAINTKLKGVEVGRDLVFLVMLGSLALIFLAATNYLPNQNTPGMMLLLGLAAIGSGIGLWRLNVKGKALSKEWLVALGCGGSWLLGAAFYLFMPISGATNPPLQWGYPRTLDGFIHALTRGQYEKIHPTSGSGDNLFAVVGSFFQTYLIQLWRFLEGLNDEFNVLYLLIALVVFLYYRKMKRRERAWIVGMIAIFFCLGPFLVLLLNFPSDRQSLDLNRVFLTSSHVFVSMFVGYGLTLLAAYMATRFATSRKILLYAGVCAVDMAVFILIVNSSVRFDFELAGLASILGYLKILCWMLAATCALIFWRQGMEQDRLLSVGLPSCFAVFSLVPTILAFIKIGGLEFFRGIGDAFSPDHYGLPVHASLILVAISLAFVGAIWFYRSRGPVAITIAVFALMPSYSIMTHWSENEQRGHWFGYWFGHDMFTPPFTGPDGKLTYDPKLREEAMKGPNGHLVYPEMTRDTILFGGTDPGRFAPTYMIFCDSFIPRKCLPEQDQNFDRRDVYIITQNALADGTYLEYIRAHYFRSDQIRLGLDTPFFQEVLRGPKEREELNYRTNLLATLAGKILDGPVQRFGAKVEANRRREGVYPPVEIYTPRPEDSQIAFQQYMADADARIRHDAQFPNEPKQVKPGEDIRLDAASGRVQVSGQIAVMSINGLLTKVIFDKNPTNEFFVEESFPLDWMFPHLTPFGVIMKINRQPLPELPEQVVERDHKFWEKFSERLIGDWIKYETPVSEVAKFAERVYLQHDYRGFKGDRAFIRDSSAQKAFSKLRSSIGGIYGWRIGLSPSGGPVPPQYHPKTQAERDRMYREADFAYKQSFAFCPYSPEAVFRYVNLLISGGRIEDALLVAQTCKKLDPYNLQVMDLVNRLEGFRKMNGEAIQVQNQIAGLEAEVRAQPTNYEKAFELASKYIQHQQSDRAVLVFDRILDDPRVDLKAVLSVASAYAQMNNPPKLEAALTKLVKLSPDSPEAWYDLAASRAILGKVPGAMEALKRAMDLNKQRLAQNPKTNDLRVNAVSDPRFAAFRNLPEFQTLTAASPAPQGSPVSPEAP